MTNELPKKRHIKLSGVVFILLFLYLVGMIIYYVFTLPISNIFISNNHLVTDKEIISSIDIKEDTPIYKVSKKKIKKRLLENNLINDVKIKKGIFGSLEILVKENKILFYSDNTHNLVLTSSKEIPDNNKFLGYPSLINYVPENIYDELIVALGKTDNDILKMVSEIEYAPDEYEGTIIDDARFLLRMNDGNKVYANTVNIEKLNDYQTIIASVNEKGTLFLDSSSDNYIFKTDGDEKREK